MSGSLHSWIFRPSLLQGGRALLGLALLALAVTAFSPHVIPSAVTIAVTPSAVTGPEVAPDAAVWPRTALRLWFLVPQLLPRHDH